MKTKIFIYGIICLFAIQMMYWIPGTSAEPAYAESSTFVYRFAVGSDLHRGWESNPNGERDVEFIESLDSQAPIQKLFLNGDLTQSGGYAYLYPDIKNLYDNSGYPYYVIAGNHDEHVAMAEIWDSGYNQFSDYYSITDGEIIWICLYGYWDYDLSVSVDVNATQLTFLEETLDANPDKLAFIICHISQRKLAWPSLESENLAFHQILVDHSEQIGGVISSHVHNYGIMTYELDSIRYSYTGVIGSDYYELWFGYYDYIIFEVYKDGAVWTVETWNEDTNSGDAVYGCGATYTPDSGLSPVWNATADSSPASVAGNWLNGIPQESKTVIFNSTSVKTCIWDVDVGNNIYMQAGYTGSITPSVTTTWNDFVQQSGTLTGNASTKLNITGNFLTVTPGAITTNVLRIDLLGDYKSFRPSYNLGMKELEVTGNYDLKQTCYITSTGIGLNITDYLVIRDTYRLTVYPFEDCIISGTVKGYGTGHLRFDALLYIPDSYIPIITGTLDCGLRLQAESTRTIHFSENLEIGGLLDINKTINGGMLTVDMESFELECGGLLLSDYSTFLIYSNDIECAGNWDTYNGTYTIYSSSDVTFSGDDSFVKFGNERTIPSIILMATDVTFMTNHDSLALYVPSEGANLFFNLYDDCNITMYLETSDTRILRYDISSENPLNVARLNITGLDPKYTYKIFEDDIFVRQQTIFREILEIVSVGNHTYLLVTYGISNEYVSDVAELLPPLLIAMIFDSIILIFAASRRKH